MIRLSDRLARTLDPANSMAEIYTNLDQTESTRTRMSGTFYWRGLFVAPIFRFLPCVRAHTRFPIFHPTRSRIVPFAPPSGTATLPAFATRSPISPSRSTLFRAAFPPSRTPSLPPPHHTSRTQPFLVFRVSVGLHLVTPLQAPSLPQTSVQRADSRFAKRIHRARVICLPVNTLTPRGEIEDAEEDLRRILEVARFF